MELEIQCYDAETHLLGKGVCFLLYEGWKDLILKHEVQHFYWH